MKKEEASSLRGRGRGRGSLGAGVRGRGSYDGGVRGRGGRKEFPRLRQRGASGSESSSSDSDGSGSESESEKASDESECEEDLKRKTFTLKQLIRKLHITEPVEHVMCLIGKRFVHFISTLQHFCYNIMLKESSGT